MLHLVEVDHPGPCASGAMPTSMRGGGVDEAHVGTGHEAFDVHEDEHAVVDAADAGDEAGVHRSVHLWGGFDGAAAEFEHVGDGIDDGADHAALDVEHDDHGEAVVLDRGAVELDAQVDDGK